MGCRNYYDDDCGMSREEFDRRNPVESIEEGNARIMAEMWAQEQSARMTHRSNQQREVAPSAQRPQQRAVRQSMPVSAPVQQARDDSAPPLGDYARAQLARAATSSARRAEYETRNAQYRQMYDLIFDAGLMMEFHPPELIASPLLVSELERQAAMRQQQGITGPDSAPEVTAARLRACAAQAGREAREAMVAAAPEAERVEIRERIQQSDRVAGRQKVYA